MKTTYQEPVRSKRKWADPILFAALVGMAATVAHADDEKPQGFPAAPTMELAPIEDAAAQAGSIPDRVARLKELATKSNAPILRAELELTAANLILGHQIEPICTRSFWGLDEVQTGAQEATTGEKSTEADRHAKLGAAFDEAGLLLDAAQESIEAAREALHQADADQTEAEGDEAQEEDEHERSLAARVTAAASHRETLDAFRKALKVALTPPNGDDGKRARRRAASGLSALVEHDDRRVATAAGFWQAYLRKDEDDPHASLARLDYALDEVTATERPYAFFARLMRCEILADHGQPVAATALLTQMEERVLDWYREEGPRHQALQAVAWTKMRTLRAWYDRLDATTQVEERNWCCDQASGLIEKTLTEPRTLPRLSPAIPLLYDADSVEAAAAAENPNPPGQ